VYKQNLRKHLEKFFPLSELASWFDPLDVRPDRQTGVLHIAFPHIFFRRRFMTHVRSDFERAVSSFDGSPSARYDEADTAGADNAPAQGNTASQPAPPYFLHADGKPLPTRRPQTGSGQKTHASSIRRESDGDKTPTAIENAPRDDAFRSEHYTLDNFLFNAKNELPVTAAVETTELVAAGRHPRYNPFVVYGPSGSGKSHLLGAMARTLQKKGLTVFYGNIMTFPALLETAPGRCPETDTSCIFLDDVQRTVSCSAIREALVALTDVRLSSGKLLALSFDLPPAAYPELGQPLLSRIASGLIVELKLPDLDIRLGYAEKRTGELHLELDKEQLLFLARKNLDIRGIDGCLARLAAYRSMTTKNGVPLSAREAFAALTLKEPEHSRLTPELIISVVAEHFSVGAEDITGKTRDKKISAARNAAVFLCRELLSLSLANIGSFFGHRDHTSILYAIKTVRKRCAVDKDTNNLVEHLKQKCLIRC
jgi:chromosomal replication initiator protein